MTRFTVIVVLLAVCLSALGCARAARDTSGFALREEAVIAAPYEETWHAVKQTLRDQGYELYTRDKRGAFVAFTPMSRVLWTQPRRTKFTIELARVAPEETAVAIESIRQVYGVTLLTHPNWHDRKHSDPTMAQALLDGIRMTLAGGELEVETFADDYDAAPDDVEDAAPDGVQDAPPVIEETALPAVQELSVEDATEVQ